MIILTLIGIRKQDPPSAELLAILRDFGLLIGIALNALAAGVSGSAVGLYFEIRDAMNRCGSYLAVFHDHADRPPGEQALGWRVWNRVERFAPRGSIEALPPTQNLRFDGSPLLYPLLQAFLAFAVAALLSSIAMTPLVPLLPSVRPRLALVGPCTDRSRFRRPSPRWPGEGWLFVNARSRSTAVAREVRQFHVGSA